MKGIIFCVECNKNSETDKRYIENVINIFYNVGTSVKIEYINLCGKGNYKSKKIEKEILTIKKRLKSSEITVIYCIDVDKSQANPEVVKLNKEIQNFCVANKYEYVWFCKDIEDVFLHKEIKDARDKQKEARRVSRENNIGKATVESLSSKSIAKRKSNLMIILDKHLERKV